MKKFPDHYYSSLLKTAVLAFVAMAGFSTITYAENAPFDSISWQETQMPSINQPVSIAYSPKTHNYVAVVIEKGGTQYQYNKEGVWGPWGVTNDAYFLDNQHPELGWQIISHDNMFDITKVVYAKGEFIFTYLLTEMAYYNNGTNSTETSPCIAIIPEKSIITHSGFMGGGCMNNIPANCITADILKKTTYIDTDKNGPYYLMELSKPLGLDNGLTPLLKTFYVAIGTQDFDPQAPLQNSYGIIAYAGDAEHGYIGLTSDGRTFSGTLKLLTTSPTTDATVGQ